MAKGENIFKRKDGRWEARYIKGHELSGKIKYGFCYGKTYKEAKEKVTQAKAAVLTGSSAAITDRRKHLSFFCDEWLASCKTKVKESTYIKYETTLRKHIKEKIGEYPVRTLSDAVVDSFTEELLYKDKLSPKTVKDILIVFHSILKFADKRHPGLFPHMDIPYPKDAAREIRVLSKEEQTRFVSCLLKDIDECKFGILLALLTGLRIGEICALKWEGISFNDRIIRISETMQRIKDLSKDHGNKTKILIGTPKSEKSKRIIPMSNEIVELCRRMNPHTPAAFILTGTSAYMEPRALQYKMKKLTEECELDGVHFHTLRHTFATRCVEAGFEIKSLSEILGHANTTITLNRYVHSSIELKRDNMNKVSMMPM